jgi:hypothetical protein
MNRKLGGAKSREGIESRERRWIVILGGEDFETRKFAERIESMVGGGTHRSQE